MSIECLQELGQQIVHSVEGNPLQREIALQSLENLHKMLSESSSSNNTKSECLKSTHQWQADHPLNVVYQFEMAPQAGVRDMFTYTYAQQHYTDPSYQYLMH